MNDKYENRISERYPEVLDRIRKLLEKKPRDLLLFYFLTQTNLPISEILNYRVNDLKYLHVGEKFPLNNQRHVRRNDIAISPEIFATFQQVLPQTETKRNDILFSSGKTSTFLKKSSISNMIKAWLRAVNAPDAVGTKSLRPHDHLKRKTNKALKLPYATKSEKHIKCIPYSQTVYDHLLEALISGNIRPGESLIVGDLAKQMSVGQMPVREALIRLETEGFLEANRSRGRVVKILSANNLREILTIRLSLENLAAETAISKCPDSTIILLEKLNKKYISAREEMDVDTLSKYNRDFHFALYEAAEMPILLSIINDLWNKEAPYFNLLYHDQQYYKTNVNPNYHSLLMNGITKRSPAEVHKWLTLDLERAAKFVINKLRALKTP